VNAKLTCSIYYKNLMCSAIARQNPHSYASAQDRGLCTCFGMSAGAIGGGSAALPRTVMDAA
jgi:hypothetical protein